MSSLLPSSQPSLISSILSLSESSLSGTPEEPDPYGPIETPVTELAKDPFDLLRWNRRVRDAMQKLGIVLQWSNKKQRLQVWPW